MSIFHPWNVERINFILLRNFPREVINFLINFDASFNDYKFSLNDICHKYFLSYGSIIIRLRIVVKKISNLKILAEKMAQ